VGPKGYFVVLVLELDDLSFVVSSLEDGAAELEDEDGAVDGVVLEPAPAVPD
jgi:hypothetical protein